MGGALLAPPNKSQLTMSGEYPMICYHVRGRIYGARFTLNVWANSPEAALAIARRNPNHKRVLFIAAIPV